MSKKFHIAIVGAGTTTLFLLHELLSLDDCALSRIVLTIFEATADAGAGFAFSKDAVHPDLLSNNAPEEIPDLLTSYIDWKKTCDTTSQSNRKVERRADVGLFFKHNYQAILAQLTQRGLSVYQRRAVIQDLEKAEQGYRLYADDWLTDSFDRVFINIGRERAAPPLKGTEYPYPTSHYSAKAYRHYNVIGSSLTAVDCVVGIANKKGNFCSSNEALTFSSHTDWYIRLFSSHGVFPRVWYPSDDKRYFSAYLRRLSNQHYQTVDEAYKSLLLPALKAHTPSIFLQVSHMSFDQMLTFLAGNEKSIDPWQKLQTELTSTASEYSQWPVILEAFLETIEFSNLSGEHRNKNEDDTLHALIAFHTAALPYESCLKLNALHNAGRLEVISRHIDEDELAGNTREDSVYIDGTGVLPAINKSLTAEKIKQALKVSGFHFSSNNRTPGERDFELLCDGKPSGVYLGSAYLQPDRWNTPGLDTCKEIAQSLRKSIEQTLYPKQKIRLPFQIKVPN
ncbi:FAD/NAD(P)-binding protein [Salinimonas chungwhensis]|uniref:FAD/NAD(P)-binding protein n=1 Tax=Salinimonas chungwhensis TaxID=265425 RepID=UPI000374E1FA|nr:FAD/NAD(P)-binding protein [Salinimonas chungwhensis]